MSNNNMPLVSIIIPVYNGSNYMREAIDSALAQTYGNIEVIVVNDGSTDGGLTDEIARSYGNKIRYYNKSNGGVSSALNFGISKMQGEYFSWLSHDDVYCCEKITHQMKYASQDRVVMCGRDLIDSKSQKLSDIRDKSRFYGEIELSWSQAIVELFCQGCFNGCTLLVPKKAFDDCGMFDEKLRYCQDLLMWAKIFLGGYGLKYIPSKDVLSRVHEKQLTNRGRDLFYSDSMYIADILLNSIASRSTIDNNILYHYASYNARYNNHDVLCSCILAGKKEKLFGKNQVVKLRCIGIYGSVRPVLRKIYYWLFKKIKTN